jgi:hypothetical protein
MARPGRGVLEALLQVLLLANMNSLECRTAHRAPACAAKLRAGSLHVSVWACLGSGLALRGGSDDSVPQEGPALSR